MPLADPSEAVLAGSPAFLNAVLPPLAAALGVRPRVADAPHQVFALCQEGARLLVFEYRGQEWLPLAEDLKTTFGDELRREREIRGISLKEIAEATKVSQRLLEAIEKDDYRYLPAPVFTRGFVREYARPR